MTDSWHLDALTARIEELEKGNARLREKREIDEKYLNSTYMGYILLRARHEALEAWIRELVKASNGVLTVVRNRVADPPGCGTHCIYDDVLDVLDQFEARFPNDDDKQAG